MDMAKAFATVAVENPGFAVIDSGATETIASLEALEAIMGLRVSRFGHEEVVVHEERKKFRFGNGGRQRAESYVELPQRLAGNPIKLGVHTLDAPGIPLLLSVKTLTTLHAVIDFEKAMICFKAVNDGLWIPLKRSGNGHLLLDLTMDWLGEDLPSYLSQTPVETGKTASMYKGAAAAASDNAHEVHEDFDATVVKVCDQESEDELIPDQLMVETHMFPKNEKQDDQRSECPPQHSSGSNMHLGATALVTLAATTSLFGDGAIFGSSHRLDQGQQGDRGQTQEEWSLQEGSHTQCGKIRLEPSGGPGSPGPPHTGVPVLGEPRSHGGRPRFSQRPKQVCQVAGMRQVSPSDPLRSYVGKQRKFSTGWPSCTRHCPCHAPSEGSCGEGASSERAFECQGGECSGSSRIFEEPSQAAGERGREVDITYQGASWSEGHRGHQEVTEERQREDRRAGRSDRGLGEGVDGTLKEGLVTMSVERQNYLQEKADDYLLEANAAYYDELYGQFGGVDLMEVCCPIDSTLVEVFLEKGRKALRVGLPAFDLSTQQGLDESRAMLRRHRPKVAWFSLPCGPYSPIQALFNEDTEEKKRRSKKRKRHSRKLIKNGLLLAREQIALGGEIGWEWPANNEGWKLPEVRAFWLELLQDGNMFTARIDGCAYGLVSGKGVPMKKPWLIKTTSSIIAKSIPDMSTIRGMRSVWEVPMHGSQVSIHDRCAWQFRRQSMRWSMELGRTSLHPPFQCLALTCFEMKRRRSCLPLWRKVKRRLPGRCWISFTAKRGILLTMLWQQLWSTEELIMRLWRWPSSTNAMSAWNWGWHLWTLQPASRNQTLCGKLWWLTMPSSPWMTRLCTAWSWLTRHLAWFVLISCSNITRRKVETALVGKLSRPSVTRGFDIMGNQPNCA